MDLEAIAPIIEKIIKDTLQEKRYAYGFAKYRGIGNKVASGKLKNSVDVKVEPRGKDYTILKIIMADYAEYVQQGRKSGKRNVPIKSLLDWIKERNLKGRDKKGRFISNLSFAFAIQKNINKYGIRPSNFIDYAFEKMLSDTKIYNLIEGAAYDDLINAIEGI